MNYSTWRLKAARQMFGVGLWRNVWQKSSNLYLDIWEDRSSPDPQPHPHPQECRGLSPIRGRQSCSPECWHCCISLPRGYGGAGTHMWLHGNVCSARMQHVRSHVSEEAEREEELKTEWNSIWSYWFDWAPRTSLCLCYLIMLEVGWLTLEVIRNLCV